MYAMIKIEGVRHAYKTATGPLPVLDGLERSLHAYFVHSYHLRAADPSDILATIASMRDTRPIALSGSIGLVRSRSSAINCGTACSGSFPTGTALQLTATPAVGSSFTSWTGACAGQGAICSLTVTGPVNTQAVFTLNTYTVSVSFTGLSSGFVETTDGSITCRNNGQTSCSAQIPHGQTLTFVASDGTPRGNTPGAAFVRWSAGPCANSTQTSCTTTVTGALNVRAEYVQTYEFILNITGGNLTVSERVNVNIGGVVTTCSPNMQLGYIQPPCSFVVPVAGTVGLSALPIAAFGGFNNWVSSPNVCAGSAPNCSFNMPASLTTVSASFD